MFYEGKYLNVEISEPTKRSIGFLFIDLSLYSSTYTYSITIKNLADVLMGMGNITSFLLQLASFKLTLTTFYRYEKV